MNPPEYFNDDPVALDLWVRICRILEKRNQFADTSFPLIEAACVSYSRFRQARKKRLETGVAVQEDGKIKSNPFAVEERMSLKAYVDSMSQLGIPRSLTKSAPGVDESEKTVGYNAKSNPVVSDPVERLRNLRVFPEGGSA